MSSKKPIPDFANEFGDLSPIKEIRGPKTPSRRQVLRLFLFLLTLGNSQLEAAKAVVVDVLKKHSTHVCKDPGRLERDVMALYQETRFYSVKQKIFR